MKYSSVTSALVILFFPAIAATAASLCSADEKVMFSCKTANNKLLSVCASFDLSKASGYLQYRFGKSQKAPELIFPRSLSHPASHFEFANEGFGARSSVRTLRFESGGHQYLVYSATYSFGDDSAGVAWKRGEGKYNYIKCNKDISEGDFYQLQFLGLSMLDRGEIERVISGVDEKVRTGLLGCFRESRERGLKGEEQKSFVASCKKRMLGSK